MTAKIPPNATRLGESLLALMESKQISLEELDGMIEWGQETDAGSTGAASEEDAFPMTKTVARYAFHNSFVAGPYMREQENGEWVKYDDIKHLLQGEPEGGALAKLRELAESQHELDPQARQVLYSRMRELYVK